VSSSELQSLRDLELVTRATVEGLRQGLHRSPLHGYSAEFSQYRHYRPGDDLKHVDWKLLARTDRVYTRQFRETTNLSAMFVIDSSRSMDFPGIGDQGSGISKFALARTVAAVLGTLVLDQGDAAGVLASGQPTRFVPARSGHHHLRVLLSELSRLQPTGTQSIADALQQVSARMKRRGLVIAISDFYEDDAAVTQLRRLARMGHDVIAVQTISRVELSFDVGGAAEFVDLETGNRLLVQPSTIRDGYSKAFATFLRQLESRIRGDGMDYIRLVTDEPLEPALRRFLVGRRAEF
jgi:uncharacterized protein (DUF58 family)